MNRRDFLQSVLTLTALAPIANLAAKAGMDGDKSSNAAAKGAQVSRRRYKNTKLTVPLLGFGMMRLPRISPGKPDIDYAKTEKQIARAMKAGVNYFDTAYFYHGGLSEKCAGDLLSKYPRNSYFLASKMPVSLIQRESDVERLWNEQLAKCKTSYFDFYLVHNLNQGTWQAANKFHVYEFLKRKQSEGKIRKLGFSFHDSPPLLETIAKAHPWDFAQIQLNYLDWTHYRSKEQYEILTELGIPVIVMEPLKGGMLASLKPEANRIFRNANPNASVASWAFRYAASLPNVLTVLSGMTLDEHLEDNIKTFTNFNPLTDNEQKIISAALAVHYNPNIIPCTSCRYCMPCPTGVAIPRVFELYNQYKANGNSNQLQRAYGKLTADEKASACVKCGACLKKCPQKIDIPKELVRIGNEINAKIGKTTTIFRSPDSEFNV